MDFYNDISKPLFPRKVPQHKYDEDLFVDPFEDREDKTDPYLHLYPPGARSSDVTLMNPEQHNWDVYDRSEYPTIPFLVRLPALIVAFGAAGLGGAIIVWLYFRFQF